MSENRCTRLLWVFAVSVGSCMGGATAWLRAEDPQPAASVPAVERPNWQIGDRWVVETLTDRIQGSEPVKDAEPKPVQWAFHVSSFEKVHGRECYRVEVECLASAQKKPKSTLWCDRDTLFLRQFQTQVVFNGSYHNLQESYDCAKGDVAPVVASINVLPLAIPAFLTKGAKGEGALGGTFTYESRPLLAEAKDVDVIRFGHQVKQEVVPAGAKSLEKLPLKFAKAIEGEPITEVRLSDREQSVVQLWKKGSPWPVYTENGRTRAWLVSQGNP